MALRDKLSGIKTEQLADLTEIMDEADKVEADLLTANILNERNPTCYGKDKRWANHLYPVYLTESYVKSKYLSTELFLHLF